MGYAVVGNTLDIQVLTAKKNDWSAYAKAAKTDYNTGVDLLMNMRFTRCFDLSKKGSKLIFLAKWFNDNMGTIHPKDFEFPTISKEKLVELSNTLKNVNSQNFVETFKLNESLIFHTNNDKNSQHDIYAPFWEHYTKIHDAKKFSKATIANLAGIVDKLIADVDFEKEVVLISFDNF